MRITFWPRRFFLPTTSGKVQWVEVPACDECGKRFDKLERRVFTLGAASVPHAHAPSSPLFPQLRTSYWPRPDDSVDDLGHKRRTFEAIRRRIQLVPSPDGTSGTVPMIPMDRSALLQLEEKLIRGLFFRRTGAPLPAGTELFSFMLAELRSGNLKTELMASTTFLPVGDGGLLVKVLVMEGAWLWAFDLWGRPYFEIAALSGTDPEGSALVKALRERSDSQAPSQYPLWSCNP